MVESFTMKALYVFSIIVIATLASAEKTIVNRQNHIRELKYKMHRGPPIEMLAKAANQTFEVDEEPLWMTQSVNHFDPQDHRTFQMRYMKNDLYLVDDGPIFIFVGGEWDMDEALFNYLLYYGHLHDMAFELNGALFYTEHRYYGETRPTENLSMENLRFLNIDQALADLAHFIVEIKASNPMLKNSKVILAGCSYSATIVTWFMQKYPHLASGAWSLSAPLETQVDYPEFFQVVETSIKKVGGVDCTNRIKLAIEQLQRWVEEKNSALIEEAMLLCYPINFDDKSEIEALFLSIVVQWAAIVQFHNEEFQIIQNECQILLESDEGNDVWNYANWYWHFYFEQEIFDVCLDHRLVSDLDSLKNIEFDTESERAWTYQTCAEFGW